MVWKTDTKQFLKTKSLEIDAQKKHRYKILFYEVKKNRIDKMNKKIDGQVNRIK